MFWKEVRQEENEIIDHETKDKLVKFFDCLKLFESRINKEIQIQREKFISLKDKKKKITKKNKDSVDFDSNNSMKKFISNSPTSRKGSKYTNIIDSISIMWLK